MSGEYNRGKVIRDPIHGLIDITKRREDILDVINTPEFQRLRRIRQLGVSHYTYPGAVHTRFAHSLGVFHFAQRIIEMLSERYSSVTRLSSILVGETTNHAVLAALLHDIGHGPFSHLSERAFDTSEAHEDKTKEIINDTNSGIHAALQKFGSDAIKEIRQMLDSCKYPFMHDIVSSQLDADRMDYLLRDSLSAGVRYGHYDHNWLLNSFCLGLDPYSEKSNNEQLRLCLDDKRGEHAATQLIIARMHMNFQVYFHPTTRCWEAHILALFKEAARLAESDELPSETFPVVKKYFKQKGKLSNDDFIQLDDSVMESHFSLWKNASEPQYEFLRHLSQAITTRKKWFSTIAIPSFTSVQLASLKHRLLESYGPESEDKTWVMDIIKSKSYKVPDTGGEDIDYAQSIMLSSGSITKKAKKLESSNSLIKGLANNIKEIQYLFIEDSEKRNAEAIIAEI